MKLPILILGATLAISPFLTSKSYAHCEVPCGIYNDEARITLIKEDITTIEKAMKKIAELSKDGEKNYNQIVRWVTNKEKHAENIQKTVFQYFMTQRLKPVAKENKEEYAKYQLKLQKLHHLLFYSMKAKQSTDSSVIKKLRTASKDFETAYFGKKKVHTHADGTTHSH